MLAFSGNALAQQQQAKPANAATPAKSPATANAAGAKPCGRKRRGGEPARRASRKKRAKFRSKE